MTLTDLCADLTIIRDQELRSGNEVSSVAEHEFAKCDLFVSLKRPFTKNYDTYIDQATVIATTNADPHYPIGKSYYCKRDRHALFAPQTISR